MSRVLVIEDDVAILDNLVDTLEAAGYEAIGADNGYTGIEIATRRCPDLIICDIMMPGIDGYEVINRLRNYDRTATTPFIFLTARAERDDQRKGMVLGADDYLTKPFAPQELIEAVRSRLRRQGVIVQKYEEAMNTLRENIMTALPHELRTPLSLIVGYAQMLNLEGETPEPEQVRELSGAILRAGERLQRLIENYLVHAQIEIMRSDQQRVEKLRAAELKKPSILIAHAAKNRAEAHERPLDLYMHLADTPICLSEDALKKIVEELVDNAFKFSAPGTPVTVSARRDGTDFLLEVTDTGRGMTAEQIGRLGAYMQFDRALLEQQGLGLGLNIARQLTELMRGTMKFTSQPQHGTQVSVRFPI